MNEKIKGSCGTCGIDIEVNPDDDQASFCSAECEDIWDECCGDREAIDRAIERQHLGGP